MIRLAASKKWEKNFVAYYEQLEQIRPRLSVEAYEFFAKITNPRLHGDTLLSFSVGDGINISPPDLFTFEKHHRETSVTMRVLCHHEDEIYILNYKQIGRTVFDFPTTEPLFHADEYPIADWGYDELTVVDDEYLRHEILFSSGAIIAIDFKEFSYSTENIELT